MSPVGSLVCDESCLGLVTLGSGTSYGIGAAGLVDGLGLAEFGVG